MGASKANKANAKTSRAARKKAGKAKAAHTKPTQTKPTQTKPAHTKPTHTHKIKNKIKIKMKAFGMQKKKAHAPKKAAKAKFKLKFRPKSKKALKSAKKALKRQVPTKNKIQKKKAKGKTITIKEAAAQPKRELSREIQELLSKAETRHWLIELGGENALDVVKGLPSVPSDEELAKKLKIRVSDVRASLNKLHNEGLVFYMRDKNSETGWYSYAWVINEDRIKRWVEEKYAQQQAYAPQDGVALYFCKDCGLSSAVSFEAAADCSFKCPNCSRALDFLDAEKFEQLRKPKESR